VSDVTIGSSDGRQVAEQNAAYRRGVVLGLTMAEAGILIIFVLLLLIGFDEWNQALARDHMRGMAAVPQETLVSLESAQSQLREIVEAVDMTLPADSEQIAVLVRAVREAMKRPDARSALEEAKQATKEMQRVAKEMAAKGGQTLGQQVERQSFRIANQEGQLKHLQGQLEKAGLGKGERPCWVKPDGTIEYLFDVVLTDDGIRMRENALPARSRERETLPMPTTDPSETLSPAEFLRLTGPLYESSLAANCRFFVTVFDATGPAEKDRYKKLLRTVEGHFYKRLSLDVAPF
jgi:hypothetical protein